ncbi:hypothetical protein ACIPSA_08585 [Streptomyces sp. NPDC086549]|uniref:hypothetical protein n=1 Tax=Streptomyces sp. NPDC086549 TaxID=3365752 RepID=UPI0038165D35
MDETPPEQPSGARGGAHTPNPTPAAGGSDWGVFVDDAHEPVTPGAPRPEPAPPSGVPTPTPEVVASLLKAGETLWAQVDGTVAVLGSGVAVTAVYDAEPDGFSGWRPVTVLDPAALTVRPVSLSLAEPPVGAATSVAELYSDTEPLDTARPHRAAPFPVGQGPDVEALLNRAAEEERARVRAEAAVAAQRAEAELAAARREAAERAEVAERHARAREERAQEEVRRARDEAARQVAEVRAESQRQVAAARDEVGQAVQHWQFRTQQAESERTRLTEELNRANRAGLQRLVLVGVLAVIAVVLAVVLKAA